MNININKYPILSTIENPKILRKLSIRKVSKLCDELRNFLLDSVSKSSGHLASGLGTIELTVALHYVFNTPFDLIIWDIGHQAYPHKILTGRRDKISTIRQINGLHPFPCRDESIYDALSVGHSSTSISAGIGMAVASKKENLGRHTVCIIGDGAITAGIAFEAINHAGDIQPDILIILNDNSMSISKNVGALNNHLAQIISSKLYSKLKENSKKFLSIIPTVKEIIKKTEQHIKGMMVEPSSIFEIFGFNYIGPINGHNVCHLIKTLKNIKTTKGPQILHVITKKGFGYPPAENDPINWHAVPKFNLKIGVLPKKIKTQKKTYSNIFGEWLCDTAAHDDKLIAITPAMCEGSGMNNFAHQYPKQFFDVAIAEQHAVTFAAGLATQGYKPVVAIYSTFLQRAYDQIIHDIAIQNLPVLFAVDRGGIVGYDGQTHQGAFDLSYLRCIPNIIIMTPSDENECRLMLHTGYNYEGGPTIVRYPRGWGIGIKLSKLYKLTLSKGRICRTGNRIAILNFGTLLEQATEVADTINATLIDMRFVKPLDEILINEIINNHQALITIEENAIMGGAGSAVNEFLMKQKKIIPVLNIGLPDYFIKQGEQNEIKSTLGLDSKGILLKIQNWMKK